MDSTANARAAGDHSLSDSKRSMRPERATVDKDPVLCAAARYVNTAAELDDCWKALRRCATILPPTDFADRAHCVGRRGPDCVRDMTIVTQILGAIEQGDSLAAAQVLPLVYESIHKPAAARLARKKAAQMLRATVLVHEACLRLFSGTQAQNWNHALEIARRFSGFPARTRACSALYAL